MNTCLNCRHMTDVVGSFARCAHPGTWDAVAVVPRGVTKGVPKSLIVLNTPISLNNPHRDCGGWSALESRFVVATNRLIALRLEAPAGAMSKEVGEAIGALRFEVERWDGDDS